MAHDLPHPLISFVANLHGVTAADVLGTRRWQEISVARAVVCWILQQYGYGSNAIGRMLDKDHTSVLHAIARVERDVRLRSHATECLQLLEHDRAAVLRWRRSS